MRGRPGVSRLSGQRRGSERSRLLQHPRSSGGYAGRALQTCIRRVFPGHFVGRADHADAGGEARRLANAQRTPRLPAGAAAGHRRTADSITCCRLVATAVPRRRARPDWQQWRLSLVAVPALTGNSALRSLRCAGLRGPDCGMHRKRPCAAPQRRTGGAASGIGPYTSCLELVLVV